MLRKEIEDKYGKDWWKRQLKISTEHVIKLCVRGIEEDLIREALRCGVICAHPEKAKRYKCIHKKCAKEYVIIIFVPGNNSNFIISGFQAKPEDTKMYENLRGA